MNLFKFSSAVTNIIAKMYSQPLKYVINLKLPFQMIHAVVVVQCLYPSLFLELKLFTPFLYFLPKHLHFTVVGSFIDLADFFMSYCICYPVWQCAKGNNVALERCAFLGVTSTYGTSWKVVTQTFIQSSSR